MHARVVRVLNGDLGGVGSIVVAAIAGVAEAKFDLIDKNGVDVGGGTHTRLMQGGGRAREIRTCGRGGG